MSSSNWADVTAGLGGKSPKPKKKIREIRTRKGKSGGYIHEHHHTNPEHHPMEEHTSADQDAMVQHMMQNMGSPSGGDAAPSPDDAAQAAPAPAPAMAPPSPMAGGM